MGKVFEGSMIGTGLKFAIVAARFNNFIGRELVAGAEDTLIRSGVSAEDAVALSLTVIVLLRVNSLLGGLVYLWQMFRR